MSERPGPEGEASFSMESLDQRMDSLGVEDLAADPDNIPDQSVDAELEQATASGDESDVGLLSNETRQELAAILTKLPDRDREVVEMRFGLNGVEQKTLEEIGQQLGVTRERVRQIELRALETLRGENWRTRNKLMDEPKPFYKAGYNPDYDKTKSRIDQLNAQNEADIQAQERGDSQEEAA